MDQTLVFQDGFLIGGGVEPCCLLPHVFLKPVIDEAVLGSNLGGCALCLAAADPVCFQNDYLFACLGQIVGCQDSSKAGSDDSYVCSQVSRKGIAGWDGYWFWHVAGGKVCRFELSPDGVHCVCHSFRLAFGSFGDRVCRCGRIHT